MGQAARRRSAEWRSLTCASATRSLQHCWHALLTCLSVRCPGSLESPLHCAIRSASTSVVEQLLDLGIAAKQGTGAQHLRNCLVLRHGVAATAKMTLRHVEQAMVRWLGAPTGWQVLQLGLLGRAG